MPTQTTNSTMRTLGVLTGGGDVPGLNAAIKALVYRGEHLGIRIIGLRSGWEGITYLNRSLSLEELTFRQDDPDTWKNGYIMPLNRLNTYSIDRQGGTILQSTRTNPAKTQVGNLPEHLASHGKGHKADEHVDLTEEVLKNMSFLGLDGLIVIGGDD